VINYTTLECNIYKRKWLMRIAQQANILHTHTHTQTYMNVLILMPEHTHKNTHTQ